MKKILLRIVLTLFLLAGLCACGGGGDIQTSPDNELSTGQKGEAAKQAEDETAGQSGGDEESPQSGAGAAGAPAGETAAEDGSSKTYPMHRLLQYPSLEEEAMELIPMKINLDPRFDLSRDSIELAQLSGTDKVNMLLEVFTEYEPLIDEDTLILRAQRDDFKRYFEDLSFLEDYDPDDLLVPFTFSPESEEGNAYYIGEYPYPSFSKEEEYDHYYLHFEGSKREGNTLKLEYCYWYCMFESRFEFNEASNTGGTQEYMNIYKEQDQAEYLQTIRAYEFGDIKYDQLNTVTFSFDITNDNVRFLRMQKN